VAALVVYLLTVPHLPVERAAQLIADMTGVKPSTGYVHGMLARAGGQLEQVDALTRAQIAASPVLGFEQTTLRVAPQAPAGTSFARTPPPTRRSGSAGAAWPPSTPSGSSTLSPAQLLPGDRRQTQQRNAPRPPASHHRQPLATRQHRPRLTTGHLNAYAHSYLRCICGPSEAPPNHAASTPSAASPNPATKGHTTAVTGTPSTWWNRNDPLGRARNRPPGAAR
jgi:hypothetical protein